MSHQQTSDLPSDEKTVSDALDRYKIELNEISQAIWKRPEVLFQEIFAHDLLTEFLEQHGFTVERHYKGLDTAFRGEFQSAGFEPGSHPTVAVICEYDALPEIGHACGHNLIAEVSTRLSVSLNHLLREK